MTEITNTTARQREHIELAHATGIPVGAFVSERAILNQEAEGQREVVASTKIPTDMHNKPEEFEALGFVLGEVDKVDPMWREATLPAGWSREGSDHAMWSYIIDEKGFRRCSIFYKAAFYDRSAHIGIQRTPETRAQNETYEAFADEFDKRDGDWQTYNAYREGDNLVRVARRHLLDEDGKRVYDLEKFEAVFTDEVRERVIAPDGSVVEDR